MLAHAVFMDFALCSVALSFWKQDFGPDPVVPVKKKPVMLQHAKAFYINFLPAVWRRNT